MEKRIYTYLMLVCILLVFPLKLTADGGLVAFYKLGYQYGTITSVKDSIENVLFKEKFELLGTYHPAKNTNLMVITFTRNDLKELCTKHGRKSIMASVMRVGLIASGDSVGISLLNPEYIFFAYLRDDIKKVEIELNQISLQIKAALNTICDEFNPFIISSLSERELMEYRFLVRNPGFDDNVLLMEYKSFEEGIKTIQANLKARKEGTYKVYEIILGDRNVAVFGIGLHDPRKGEAVFLSQLGFSHLAALPYELLLIDNKASILHGKFRFPLYWSDLSMTDYRKIYKTPREIEETMRSVTR
jgi:hypothetical protein